MTPVEAITQKLQHIHRAADAYRSTPNPILVAALELAKADAELIAHKAAEPKHPDPNFIVGTWTFEVWGPWHDKIDQLATAIESARTKLYEASQK